MEVACLSKSRVNFQHYFWSDFEFIPLKYVDRALGFGQCERDNHFEDLTAELSYETLPAL